jgi:hypothetical protein
MPVLLKQAHHPSTTASSLSKSHLRSLCSWMHTMSARVSMHALCTTSSVLFAHKELTASANGPVRQKPDQVGPSGSPSADLHQRKLSTIKWQGDSWLFEQAH